MHLEPGIGVIYYLGPDSGWNEALMLHSAHLTQPSDRDSGRRPFNPKTLPQAWLSACAYLRGAKWPIF